MEEIRFSIWLNGEHYMYAASSDDAKSFLLSQVFKPFLDEAKDMNELYVRAYELKEKDEQL